MTDATISKILKIVLDTDRYFEEYRIMPEASPLAPETPSQEEVSRIADMFAALGSEPRLRIMRLLLSAHPTGMVVGEVAAELDVTPSTLSHHLDKLKNESLVQVRREGTFLRYSANTDALERLLGFLYAECCTRNRAVEPQKVVCCQ